MVSPKSLYINNEWIEGKGDSFESLNPATEESIWKGRFADFYQVDTAVNLARRSFEMWSRRPQSIRTRYVEIIREKIESRSEELAEAVSKETGKALWETRLEVKGLLSKIDITMDATKERCSDKEIDGDGCKYVLKHKAHGVMAVLGPFNFPVHLPHGHIIPAILAGNTVVFKPSELTPMSGQLLMDIYSDAKLPDGVINMVQGSGSVGEALSQHRGVAGILFTGSSKTGHRLSKEFAQEPKILALEMGGNNPLVVSEIDDIDAAVYGIIRSAFITSGQRCTCARRLILVDNAQTDDLLKKLVIATKNIKIGAYDEDVFCGPVISKHARDTLLTWQDNLIAQGGEPLVKMEASEKGYFLSPGIIEVSKINGLADEEYFGPLLQVFLVRNIADAIMLANNTNYGLAAGLFSKHEFEFVHFYDFIRAGIINWNSPTTGASGRLPFGGVGHSGNFRPSAYYAPDYCAYPTASTQSEYLKLPKSLLPGIEI
ncbi:succinylglutamate-semialdehyde dehydrogenase [Candidatus Marinamargulisbacteria bacterium SCGC AAA071-K20]|nr:succinylglutamate-semialdehyde dehydrogenase [Candidatus Marinamargulisbacteria bacterium SCGC AAA071-K20]